MSRDQSALRQNFTPVIPADTPYSVALVGRTNVGKSTLFNRLTESRAAITHRESHLTRDRHIGPVSWNELTFNLVDTGGFDVTEEDEFGSYIKNQTDTAVEEADIILLVLERGVDLLPDDIELAKKARETKKPFYVIVNKCENNTNINIPDGLEKLGTDDVFYVSARSGNGTGDMLDALVDRLKSLPKKSSFKRAQTISPDSVQIAFVGEPNVGKSSLLNAILNDNRVIVSDVAHTTRTTQYVPFTFDNERFTLVDTAGLRKRAKRVTAAKKNKTIAEVLSARQVDAAILHADVVVLVIDITDDITSQNLRIAKKISDAGKGLIIAANKWDMLEEKTPSAPRELREKIYAYYPYLHWAPIVITSATEKRHVFDILKTAIAVTEERHKVIPHSGLVRFLEKLIKIHPPSRGKGVKHPRLIDLVQKRSDPPTFELVTEYLNLHPAYLKFMEKEMRKKFNFTGTPVHIQMRPIKN